MRRLVGEFPDKFGLTVSHTSRQPLEHEVHGNDYLFSTKAQIQELYERGQLLELAPVQAGGPGGERAYLYGTSIATVREVAATGKLCVMAVDEQGVQALKVRSCFGSASETPRLSCRRTLTRRRPPAHGALARCAQANKRIDGLYIFCAPPSLEELERRLRGRLKEAEATVDRRVAWAVAQTSAAQKPGLFDHLVPNTVVDEVYHALKEAISTLSPIIRNRLRGLPAYVLDYSDLIPPNLVEKPFLKPVIISGPTTGERSKLIEQLVTEFPDVFAFPRLTTTRPLDEASQHALTPSELEAARAEHAAALAAARGEPAPSLVASPGPGDGPGGSGGGEWPGADDGGASDSQGAGGAGAVDAAKNKSEVFPDAISVTSAEFDAAVSSGALLEYHTELFKHEMVTHRYGVTADAIREVRSPSTSTTAHAPPAPAVHGAR